MRRNRRRRSTRETLALIQYYRANADALPADVLRYRHALGWLAAGLFAAATFATIVLAPLGVLALVVPWWGHRARHQRRAEVARPRVEPIDLVTERARARHFGFPVEVWND